MNPDERMKCGISVLKKMGIPVSNQIDPHVKINTRAKKRFGCCIKRDSCYTIELSYLLVGDPSKSEMLEETLFHELLHTCPGCGNHGTMWKKYAEVVNKALGFHISRTTRVNMQEENPNFLYLLQCKSCHQEIGRHRMSKVIQYHSRYRCGICKGELIRLK